MRKGIFFIISAYTFWGISPIFWKLIETIPAREILCHRIVWSLIFTLLLLTWRRRWRWIRIIRTNPGILRSFLVTAMLLSVNWYVFIWAVNSGYIIDSSLGYFINPLLSVLLGVIFLKERLRRWQGVSVFIALIGVVYLTIIYGKIPWVALILAVTFGMYGLLRKTAALGSLEGLGIETALLLIPALTYLLFLESCGSGALGHVDAVQTMLLLLSGIVTASPLILFAAGARRIPLNMVGFFQYIAPSLQFLVGYMIYHEPLSLARLAGFIIIWIALIIYTVEGFIQNTARRPVM
jgi:chloramphenicol-sensitive protein RarD